MDWLFTVFAGVVSAISLYLSKPEQKNWAFVCLCLILLGTSWQAYDQYSHEKTAQVLNERAHIELEAAIGSFLQTLAYLEVAASDGQLPTTMNAFFSDKTADDICNHLNFENKSLSLPPKPWWQYVGEETRRYHKFIRSILDSKGDFLRETLNKSVAL